MSSKWVVHTKGGYTTDGFEICVIRDNNKHGKESYGWFDKNKILVSESGSLCKNKIANKIIWDGLVELAHKVADILNESEKS